MKYTSIAADVRKLNTHAGLRTWIEQHKHNTTKIKQWQEFRLSLLEEELLEGKTALITNDAPEFVDAMIDAIVIAAGTLDALGVDVNTAWERVQHANLQKQPGTKPGRPNPLGLPDLTKPAGWAAPEHSDNTGILAQGVAQ
jgi:hypothetical protein